MITQHFWTNKMKLKFACILGDYNYKILTISGIIIKYFSIWLISINYVITWGTPFLSSTCHHQAIELENNCFEISFSGFNHPLLLSLKKSWPLCLELSNIARYRISSLKNAFPPQPTIKNVIPHDIDKCTHRHRLWKVEPAHI